MKMAAGCRMRMCDAALLTGKALLSPQTCWVLGLSSTGTTPNLSVNKQQILQLFFFFFSWHVATARSKQISPHGMYADGFSQCKTKSGVGSVLQKLLAPRWVKGSYKALPSLPLLPKAQAPKCEGGSLPRSHELWAKHWVWIENS